MTAFEHGKNIELGKTTIDIEGQEHKAIDVVESLAWEANLCGNHGVGTFIVEKKTGVIVAIGLNSIVEEVNYTKAMDESNEAIRFPVHTDGHSEINALNHFHALKRATWSKVLSGEMTEQEWEEKFDPKNYMMITNLCPCQMCRAAAEKVGIEARYFVLDDKMESIEKVYPGEINKEVRENMQRLIQSIPATIREQERAGEPFYSTAKAVRAVKKKKQAGARGVDEDLLNVKKLLTYPGTEKEKRIAEIIEAKIKDVCKECVVKDDEGKIGYNPHKSYEQSLDPQHIDQKIIEMVATEAIASRFRGEGNDTNAVAIVDRFGTVWAVVGDRTGQKNPQAENDPLKTPLMQALNLVEDIASEIPANLRKHFPRPSEFTFVCYKEPIMLEAARAANAYVNTSSICYLTENEERGVVSAGQLGGIGELYAERGMTPDVHGESAIRDTVVRRQEMAQIMRTVTPKAREKAKALVGIGGIEQPTLFTNGKG